MTRIIALILCLWCVAPARGQDGQPDRRGEVVAQKPYYRGVAIPRPIDPKFHMRNEGGSNGAGLCVISSVIANGNAQGVPGLDAPDQNGAIGKGSPLWTTAKRRPGGYSPDKLARLVDEVMPSETYASFITRDPEELAAKLEQLSKEGYKVGITMNTGQLYRYMPIHHMVSNDYFRRDGYAAIVDNNRPGFWSFMPAKEMVRRSFDGGVAWLWIWTRKPSPWAVPNLPFRPDTFVPYVVSAVLWLAGWIRRRIPSRAAA